MEQFWQIAVSIAGIGAIGFFVFLALYKQWLKLGIFAKLTSKQTFILMRTFLVLTFLGLMAALVAFIMAKKGQVASTNPTTIEQLVVYIRWSDSEPDAPPEQQTLIPKSATPPVSEPLGIGDAFKISAHFDRPTEWRLLRFDPSGGVEIVARSLGEMRSLDYPPGHELRVISGIDAEGVHVHYLATGILTSDQETGLLAELRRVGLPPAHVPQAWGQTRGATAKLDQPYLHDIEERLGQLEPIYALFTLVQH